MQRWVKVFAYLGAAPLLGAAVLYAYTVPALRRLPDDGQRSLDGVTTIDDAVRYLQRSGKTSWELVAAAQTLVNAKMAYSRRNSWDTPSRAFRRGLGYCQQRGMALLLILRKLGIAARPVYALRCQFPPQQIHEYWESGGVSAHMWLVVSIDGVEKDVCPGDPANTPGHIHFTVLSHRRPYGPAMRLFGHIGSMVLNVRRDNAALRQMRTQKRSAPAHVQNLSPIDRLALFVEYVANKRLRGLGPVVYRLTGGPRERDVLLLTTRGRKSGREHTVLLQGFRDGASMLVVAANSGRPTHPDWFYNLKASPTASIEIAGHRQRVRAEELSDEEARAFWPRILQRAPGYTRYLKATDRVIPLVRLVPIGLGEKGQATSRASEEAQRQEV